MDVYPRTEQITPPGEHEFALVSTALHIYNSLAATGYDVAPDPGFDRLCTGPFADQIATRGLGLVYFYGRPGKLITPFGKFALPRHYLPYDKTDEASTAQELTAKARGVYFTSQLVQARKAAGKGPYRQITAINGVELPPCELVQADDITLAALAQKRRKLWGDFHGETFATRALYLDLDE
jgi:hypothetical protein